MLCDIRQSFGVQNKQTLERLRLRGLLVSFHISVLVQFGEIISGGKRSSVRGCGETGRMQLGCLSSFRLDVRLCLLRCVQSSLVRVVLYSSSIGLVRVEVNYEKCCGRR